MTRIFDKRCFDPAVFLLFCALASVLYSQTLNVPWIFDDYQNITANPLIRSIPATIRSIFAPRGVAFFTFALNYSVGELNVSGFHITNIFFHIMASWFAYLVAKRAFPEQPTAGIADRPNLLEDCRLPAFFVGCLFLVHPLQTQAVNYIVQRMTGLSALFFLMALYCYVKFRETASAGIVDWLNDGTVNAGNALPVKPFIWYSLALLLAALALMTKQNAAVIPAALLLFDWLVLNRGSVPAPLTRRILVVVPFFLLSCLFIYIQVGKDDVLLKDAGRAEYWAKAGESSAIKKIAPGEPAPPAGQMPKPMKLEKPPENLQLIYFVTELSVLWLYLRLLLLPYCQVFDYGYPLSERLYDIQTVVAGSGLLMLMVLALVLARRKQPLVAFGIFWYFLTLAVESTIIPLDAAVEHRLYMPVFGFALSLVAIVRHIVPVRKFVLLLLLVVGIYGWATWQRNLLWADPVAFALDGVAKASHNQRNHLTLANAYADAGRWVDAEKTLRKAISLRPYYHIPYDNLGSALVRQGKLSESRYYFSVAAILDPMYPNAVYNYGYASLKMGDMPAALRSLQRLKELDSSLAMQLGAQFVNKSGF